MTTLADNRVRSSSPASDYEGASGSTILSYRTYQDVRAAVDRLSDAGFPVRHVRILGQGLTSVETVTGRLTKGRAAVAGAATGAWIGLLLGLLLGLFTPALAWLGVLLTSLVLGGAWGAVVGFVGHLATQGRRDFTSQHGFAAQRYDLVLDQPMAAEARRILASEPAV